MTPSDTAHPEGERELLPCPFCGSDVVFAAEQKHCTPPFPEMRCVSCAECDAYGPEKWTDAEAIAAWNTRPVVRPQGEEGWLIEGWSSKRNEFKAEWWSLTPTEDERGQWTKNSLHALRFARECDAQAYIAEAGWTEARPTEHAWSALSNQGKPSS